MRDQREFELKLALPEAALKRVRAHPELKARSIEPAVTRQLRSIYFDTPDHALRAQGLALRLRKTKDGWVQTVKSGGRVTAGVSNPRECEAPLTSAAVDTAAIKDAELRAAVEAAQAGRALEPVFETRVRRTLRRIRAECDGELEVALDLGEVRSQGRAQPISEVEIELKSGEMRSVFALAKALFGDDAPRMSAQNKAEQGYRLADRAAGANCPSEALKESARRWRPAVAPGDSGADAFQKILEAVSDQIAARLPQIFESEDLEGPHQFRVGLRRLRAALKLHAPALRKRAAGALGRDARRLFREVGRLRDADVVCVELLDPAALEGANIPPAALTQLRERLETRRAALRVDVRAALREGRVGDFIFDLGSALATRSWRPKSAKKRALLKAPAERLAREAIGAAWADAARWGDRIETLDVPERHEMRKAVKSARYAIEFHRGLYPKERAAPFVGELKKLQTVFGGLSDLAVLEGARVDAPDDPALEAAIAHHQLLAERAWRKAKKRWRALAEQERFW